MNNKDKLNAIGLGAFVPGPLKTQQDMKKEQRMDQVKNLFGTRRPNYSGLNGRDLKLLETKGLYPAQAAMTAPKPMIILCFGDDEHRNLARLVEKIGLTGVKLIAAMEGDQRL